MRSDPFLSFRTLISGTIIKAIYVGGLIVITAGGGLLMVFPLLEYSLASGARRVLIPVAGLYVAGGAAVVVVGNVLWRLLCEGWILIFSIHEMLASIENKLTSNNEYVLAITEQMHALDTNAEQRHQELLESCPSRTRP